MGPKQNIGDVFQAAPQTSRLGSKRPFSALSNEKSTDDMKSALASTFLCGPGGDGGPHTRCPRAATPAGDCGRMTADRLPDLGHHPEMSFYVCGKIENSNSYDHHSVPLLWSFSPAELVVHLRSKSAQDHRGSLKRRYRSNLPIAIENGASL